MLRAIYRAFSELLDCPALAHDGETAADLRRYHFTKL
jgi:hypothetical protein